MDLIQFHNFQKAIIPVMSHLKREVDEQKRRMEIGEQFEGHIGKLRKELDAKKREQEGKDAKEKALDPVQKAIE
jgi:hypothetical protein